jgi:dTDP-4-dehydrorhamnose 3,5-epimerase
VIVRETEIPGVLLIQPEIYEDSRGSFYEGWSSTRYADHGVPASFVQDNYSVSHRDVLRGLHLQHPHGQGKLVHTIVGSVYDVVVDVRRGSPSYGKWVGVRLGGDDRLQMYIPPGLAHGFCVLSDTAVFAYKCSEVYRPETEIGVAWNDPDLGIDWPTADPILSDRDAALDPLRAIDPARLPNWG